MKYFEQRHILNLFNFFIIISVVAIWSSRHLIEWHTDFGLYYVGHGVWDSRTTPFGFRLLDEILTKLNEINKKY